MSHHDVPPGLQVLLEMAVGYDWPNGDEKKLRSDAAAWRSAGSGLGGLLIDASRSARTALAGLGGPTRDAFARFWSLADAAASPIETFCAELADSLDAVANQIETLRAEIIAQLSYLSLQLSWDTAVAIVNPPAAGAAAQSQIAATRTTCRTLLRRAAQQIIVHEIKQAGLQAFFDFVAQSVEHARKHRGGLDGRELGAAAAIGAVGGAIGLGMGGAVRGLAGGVADRAAGSLAGHVTYRDLSVGGKAAYQALHVTGEAALGAVTGATEGAVEDAALNSGTISGPADARTGAINGAAQGAIGRGRNALNPRGITPLPAIKKALQNRWAGAHTEPFAEPPPLTPVEPAGANPPKHTTQIPTVEGFGEEVFTSIHGFGPGPAPPDDT